MIKKLIFLSTFTGMLGAMDEHTPLKPKGITIEIVRREMAGQPLAVSYRETFQSDETIGQVKQRLSKTIELDTQKIILHALPSTLGLIASNILDDKQLVAEVTSRYSHRFLLGIKKS